MERVVQVAKDDNALANVPKNLAGLRLNDLMVISKFPKGRDYPDCAKYLEGVHFRVDDVCRWNLQRDTGYFFKIEKSSFDKATSTAIDKIKANGYKGDFSDFVVTVFTDMVDFVEARGSDEKPAQVVHSMQIPDSEKDPAIIEEMISKVDKDRLEKMISISMERGKKPKQEVFDWFLHEWALRKYEFYIAFGRQFSVSAPISFKMDETEMQGSIYELYRKFPKYAATLDLVARSGGRVSPYAENRLPEIPFFQQYFPTLCTKGINLSKFLSRLFEDSDFDIEFSKVMQDREIKGNIVISIDPYDFLTSSINMHGWHSCHALNGQYRAGTYGFCTDDSSMVVFRDNGREYDYGICTGSDGGNRSTFNFGKNAFKGNSKSWRQMVHVDKKTCAAVFSREYPSNKEINDVRETARGLLEGTLSKYLGIPNEWDNFGDLEGMAQKAYFGTVLYQDVTNHHYSDIASWSSLVGSYKIQKCLIAPKDTDMSQTSIKVGGVLKCFGCGKVLDKGHSGSVLCRNGC